MLIVLYDTSIPLQKMIFVLLVKLAEMYTLCFYLKKKHCVLTNSFWTCFYKSPRRITWSDPFTDFVPEMWTTQTRKIVHNFVILCQFSCYKLQRPQYNLARGKIFTASIGSVDSLYPSVFIYCLNLHQFLIL